ncbi:lytic transglycosylase domain-containing protein [Pigmentiphaga aceris]|uniref:Lytic transglycosylase domain-containing protein n=1 Tax=Pigmentiphaga aceris TaxID=1940612 RepID=A0A5C0AT44_9BURK|nr:lytic transglycosylase domain-containing protein [Pigmentiphaga aceris]QEI04814.1 lytic transglycosylase domain-containing protein [Pigmentiphaga aceris]
MIHRALSRTKLLAATTLLGIACSVSAAPPPPPDSVILSARDAVRTGRWADLRNFIPQASGHVLEAYPQYWLLNQQLNDMRVPPPEGDLRAFMERYPATYLAERLRGDWILAADRRGDYSTVIALERTATSTAQIDCAILRAHHLHREYVAQKAIATFSPGEACWTLYTQLVNDGALRWEDLAPQLRDMVESSVRDNELNNTRRMAEYVFDAPRRISFKAMLENPMVWLTRNNPSISTPIDRELVVLALGRLARSGDLATGYTYVERNWGSRLPAVDLKWIRSQFAYIAALRLDPAAKQWYREADGAALSETGQAWRVRMALRETPIDWARVVAVIDQMPPSMHEDDAWAYWRARGQGALGDVAGANAAMQKIAGNFTFYGQLALEELGQPVVIPPRAAAPTDAERRRAARNEGLARALALFDIGWRTEAVREWNFAISKMKDRELIAASELAYQREVLDRAVNTADRTRDEHNFDLRFVSPFHDELVAKAREVGIDPTWVYGLIRQESRFITNAKSTAGASGLMQLMPATATWVARKIGMQGYSASSVNDLDTNLTLGTNYLRIVLEDLNNSPLLASAGYNAGPRRPHTWRGTLSGPVEGAIFAETIPFNETRDYVKKVLSNATYYAALFSGEPQSLKQRLGTVAPQLVEQTAIP